VNSIRIFTFGPGEGFKALMNFSVKSIGQVARNTLTTNVAFFAITVHTITAANFYLHTVVLVLGKGTPEQHVHSGKGGAIDQS
jgi:hypothetical protein